MKLISLAALTCFGLSAGLAAAAGSGLVPVTALQEHFEKSVPVAGTMLVGLRRGAAEGPLSLQTLAIDLPEHADEMICLDMSTRDGRYTASQDFKLQGPVAGTTPLELKPHHPEDLRGYAGSDLAVMVQWRKSCDEGAPRAYLAARWPGAANPDLLTIMLNVKLSEVSVALLTSAGQRLEGESATCHAMTAGAGTAYDHECQIRLTPAAIATAAKLRVDTISATGARYSETYGIALGR